MRSYVVHSAPDVMSTLELESAAMVLPQTLKKAVCDLPHDVKKNIEEIRLRTMRPAAIGFPGGYERKLFFLGQPYYVSSSDLEEVLEKATKSSVHSYSHSIASGYITLEGGHRLGICGACALKNGRIISMGGFSSVNIRVAKEYPGISDGILKDLLPSGSFSNTLLISPPGVGKTTLLRDLIRNLSTPGPVTGNGYRISVADERCEVFPCRNGVPQFCQGDKTDVVSGGPKAEVVMLLLRSMSPQIIAIDEITSCEDVGAILTAQNCGVNFIATAHAKSIDDLYSREAYAKLLANRYFENIIAISIFNGKREYRLLRFGGVRDV